MSSEVLKLKIDRLDPVFPVQNPEGLVQMVRKTHCLAPGIACLASLRPKKPIPSFFVVTSSLQALDGVVRTLCQ